ncbi:MAG: hypothetical protein II295_09760 [Akkermansia sp.]|nr:hypothetical protein [Akkermansia sp.]
MNIPSFWVRERRMIAGLRVRLRGISGHSQQEAEALLAERARLWELFLSSPAASVDVEAFRAELRRLDGDDSPYSAAILERIEQQADEFNIVTRNRYGCLVLNSVSLCFVDVDRFRRGFWASLFGGRAKEEQALIAAIKKECESDATLSACLYRTAHGWRVMLRGQGLSVGSEREAELFAALQADPLYAKLCRSQLCWRARLSPKPFRRGLKRYPVPQCAQQRADDWIEAYEKATAGLAVCRLVDCFGPALNDAIVELHDTATLARKADLQLG